MTTENNLIHQVELQELNTEDSKPATPNQNASSSSLDDISMVQATKKIITHFNAEKYEEQYKKNPPWIFQFRWKLLVDFGVPFLLFVLFLAALGAREKRDSIPTTCELVEFYNETYIDSSDILYVNISNSATFQKYCYSSENNGVSGYKPLSQGWKILLSLFPFVVVFQGVLAYDLSSKYVAPFGLIITIILGLWFFEDEGWWVNTDDNAHESQSNILEVSGLVFLTIVDRVIWTIFEYAFNVFTAFLFLRVLELWGIVDQMRIEFESLCPTDSRKVLLILFCFAIVIAVVAPGGSNFLIAGAIMIDINHRKNAEGEIRDDYDKRIAAICLFGNGLTSTFNLVGVCIIAVASDIADYAIEYEQTCTLHTTNISKIEECGAKQIGYYFGLQFSIFTIVAPIIFAILYNRKPTFKEKLIDIKDDIPIMLTCGVVFAVAQFLSAWLIGPELVCLIAAGSSLIVYYIIQQYNTHGIRLNGLPNFRKRKYFLPLMLLVLLLCSIGLIPNFEEWLKGNNDSFWSGVFNPAILYIHYLSYSFERHFGWLAHSGMSVLFVSIITPFIVPYYEKSNIGNQNEFVAEDIKEKRIAKNPERAEEYQESIVKNLMKFKLLDEYDVALNRKRLFVLKEAFQQSAKESLPIMVSIGSYAAIAKVMSGFNMTKVIALGIVDWLSGAPAIFTAFIPIIGALGAGLSGSTTTSNFLFSRLEIQTCVDLNLIQPGYNSVWEVIGVQVLGATAGEIISPMNAVFSTLLLNGKFPESEIIKTLIWYFFWWLVGCIIVSIIFLVPRNSFD